MLDLQYKGPGFKSSSLPLDGFVLSPPSLVDSKLAINYQENLSQLVRKKGRKDCLEINYQ